MSSYIHGKSIISIAIAEDHELVREALSSMINGWENCKVVIQAADGNELVEKMAQTAGIQLAVLDASMPLMDGCETAKWIRANRPKIKILMLSAFSTELAISLMIKAGANGYISKSDTSRELKKAIFEIMKTGCYFANSAAGLVARQLLSEKKYLHRAQLNETELALLKHLCTDMTYKEIAVKLELSERQVDYLRESLFSRFNIQSRSGLVSYILKSGVA